MFVDEPLALPGSAKYWWQSWKEQFNRSSYIFPKTKTCYKKKANYSSFSQKRIGIDDFCQIRQFKIHISRTKLVQITTNRYYLTTETIFVSLFIHHLNTTAVYTVLCNVSLYITVYTIHYSVCGKCNMYCTICTAYLSLFDVHITKNWTCTV